MAHDQELADRLRLLLSSHRPTEKQMFGGLAFLVDGHLAVAVSGQGGLMVRVPPAQNEALRREPGVEPMVMRGRPMTGWLRVGVEVLEDDDVLRWWAERGVDYTSTLPPKQLRTAGRRPGSTSTASGRVAGR